MLFIVACVTGLAPASEAATKYVTRLGAGSRNGTSLANAWTMGDANANAAAGDVVFIQADATPYPTGVNPQNAGTSGNRIVFCGSSGNIAGATVPDITISLSYITVKWLTCTGDMEINTFPNQQTLGDSLYACNFSGTPLTLIWMAGNVDNATISTINGTGENTSNGAIRFGGVETGVGVAPGANDWADNLRVTDCNLTFNAPKNRGMTLYNLMNATFARNRFTGTTSSSDAGSIMRMYFTKFSVFEDCRWSVTQNNDLSSSSTYEHAGSWTIRDSSYSNAFVRDTVINSGPYRAEFYLSNSGSFSGSLKDNTFDYCVFKNANGPSGLLQHDGDGYKLRFCSFSSDTDPALTDGDAGSGIGPNFLLRNCTLRSSGAQTIRLFQGFDDTGNRVASNIFYAAANPSSCANSQTIANFGDAAAMIDSNLYFNPNSGAVGKTIYRPSGSCSDVGSEQAWCSTDGKDCGSLRASPVFADSTFSTFDYWPKATGHAVKSTWPNGFVGITAPPAKVTNLSFLTGTSTMIVAWTAPGANGSIGTATSYDLRYSTSVITDETSWGSATPFSGSAPQVSGTTECEDVSSVIACDQRFYWALKTTEANGHTSAMSNVPTQIMNCDGSDVDCGSTPIFGARRADDEQARIGYAVPNPALSAVAFDVAGINGAMLRVYDVAGRLMARAEARGGRLVWNLHDIGGARVRPGLYVGVIIHEGGSVRRGIVVR